MTTTLSSDFSPSSFISVTVGLLAPFAPCAFAVWVEGFFCSDCLCSGCFCAAADASAPAPRVHAAAKASEAQRSAEAERIFNIFAYRLPLEVDSKTERGARRA